MSAPIFISYSSKDQQIAETIYQALEARGLDCWIASRDVRAGENFQEAIVRALRSAKVMLLVFTSNANNSDEIKKELVLAGRHRVTVVPVRVEDVVPNDAFTYELATRQWIDLFKDWERQIELLASRLGQILQTENSHEAGGAGYTLLSREMDVRPGGREHVSGRWESGTVSTFDAVYHDIVRDERIVYSYEMHLDDKKISVSLAILAPSLCHLVLRSNSMSGLLMSVTLPMS